MTTTFRIQVLVLAGAIGCAEKPAPQTATTDAAPPATATATPVGDAATGPGSVQDRADKARIQGSETAKVWLVMSSDFQCPYCKQFHDEAYADIVRDYVNTGKIRFAYMNHPMPFHQFAVPAAEAAMCAGAQDRFWPMHDALYATQGVWTKRPFLPVFDSLAVALKLDVPAWQACMRSHATRSTIDSDYAKSRQAGVNGTPSFVIIPGGRMVIEGIAPYREYKRTLDSALAAAGSGR